MKISESWLRSFVNPPVDTITLSKQLTSAGLEVEQCEPVASAFSGVVVAEILSIEPHPNADKLRVCHVQTIGEPIIIVTNATNVYSGMKVPLATIGAVLKNGEIHIKKSALRGVESFGMFCSAVELGLAETSDGIFELPTDAPLGADVREYLQLNDTVIEISITPNRGDCISVLGIAREVSAIADLPMQAMSHREEVGQETAHCPVKISAKEACPYYTGRVISDINPRAKTPLWMRERLRRAGVRSIHPVVDVTNYVMLELGQPMHAFDLAKISHGIEVRQAHPLEQLQLLDETECTLQAETVVIADKKQALAIAGVMGGLSSAVTPETTSIFLESAHFTPEAIAGQAKRYHLVTDSAYRFERGVDSTLPLRALHRATALLLSIVGGVPGVIETVGAPIIKKTPIILREARLQQLLGTTLSTKEIAELLRRLHFSFSAVPEGFSVIAPSFRFDIRIEEDLIEEIGRLKGYDHIPAKSPWMQLPLPRKKQDRVSITEWSSRLVALGYQEIVSYSFIEKNLQATFDPALTPLILTNPISEDMSVMRTSLLPGLLQTYLYNQKRQQRDVRLFEIGLCFIPNKTAEHGLLQQNKLAGLLAGHANPTQWGQVSRAVDFFDIKGEVEQLLSNSAISFLPMKHSALHPEQTAQVQLNGQTVGYIGALHPLLCQTHKISPVFFFELDVDAISARSIPTYQAISKFPLVERDIAMIVLNSHSADRVLQVIREHAGDNLIDLFLFDVYAGETVKAQNRSLAVRLLFQNAIKTLSDEEIEAQMTIIRQALTTQLSAEIRSA